MADVQLATQTVPATPASGNALMWFDTTGMIPCWVGSDGNKHGRTVNASVANQTIGATDTWVTGSDLLIPSFGFNTKTMFTWELSASKGAAGAAAPTYTIRTGANRSTSDTSRLALAGPAQTAIADIGTLYISVIVRNVGAAGVIQGTAFWSHRGTAANTTTSGTGFANDTTGHVEGTSAAFDNSALQGQYISLSINGNTAASWTVTQVRAEADW